jgi:hypothetical protein
VLNKAFNDGFFVDDLPDAPGGISVRQVLREPFAELHEAQGSYLEQGRVMSKRSPDQQTHDVPQKTTKPADSNLSTAFTVEGWSEQVMVGLTGFEPATL